MGKKRKAQEEAVDERQIRKKVKTQRDETKQDQLKEETKTDRQPRKRTLFLRHLSDTTEEEDLMQVWAKVVPDVKIVDVRVIRDESGVKRGIAFVDVEN